MVGTLSAGRAVADKSYFTDMHGIVVSVNDNITAPRSRQVVLHCDVLDPALLGPGGSHRDEARRQAAGRRHLTVSVYAAQKVF